MFKAAFIGAQCALIGIGLSVTVPADAKVYTVTQETLSSVFNTAKGGDTLKLVGAFGINRLQYHSFSSFVTLDARNATFTDTLDLAHDDNIKVIGGHWDVTGGSVYGRAIVVYGGSNIYVDQINVVGTAGQQGINFAGTTNAHISNSTFSGLQVGIGMGGVTGGIALKNKIYRAVSDGIDIGDSHGVTASYNSCSLGTPGAGVHPDCIQLWSTTGHPVQSDNIVTHNSASGMTQGFTSFSTGGGALRVQITYNTVNTSMSQGVACYDCFDSTISYNTLTTLAGSDHLTNLNIIGGGNNTVVGNLVHPYYRPHDDDFVSPEYGPNLDILTYDGYDEPAITGSMPALTGSTQVVTDSAPDMPDNTPDLSSLVADGSAAAVPEPATWALLIGGFAAVGIASRRRVRTVCA